MNDSSRPGTALATPPEFFVDRCLGRGFVERMRSAGWLLTRISDVYPDDAQEVSDGDWIAYGCAQGWGCLTADKRIRRRPCFDRATRPMFALSDGNLTIAEQVRRFDSQRDRIWAAAGNPDREFWVVYQSEIVRRWP